MIAEKKKKDFDFGRSLKGFNWIYNDIDERKALTLSQKLNIPEFLANILVRREISSLTEAENYLDPKLKSLLLNPFDLKDMEKAATRIANAIEIDEKITIFGDYDVDGATSSSLLKLFFKEFGIDADIYIPNRISEGYGPNSEAMQKIKDSGTELVICVDCGTVSFEPLEKAKEIGLDVIVLDHHLSLEKIPEAVAVVNPNRIDDDFPFKSLAAVGVAFLTTIAIRNTLRKNGYFKNDKNKEPDLLKFLDLVALGTVCDVMNLVGINRAFVTQGLKLIQKGNNLGMKALAKVAKLNSKAQSYHLGFILGPRINAGGRIGEGILGANLLSSEDPIEAMELANYLEQLNSERRAIESNILEESIEQIENEKLHENPLIMVKGDNWHQGILGILASRIKEKYNKPAAVISVTDGVGKGSARSIPGVDFGSLLANAKEKGIIIQGGGHAMAGGFSVEEEKIDEFNSYLIDALQNKAAHYEKAKEVEIDSILNLTAINGDLVRTIDKASPFGNGNKQPKIALLNIKIIKVRPVGKGHYMIIVADNETDPDMKNTLKCMLFKGGAAAISEDIISLQGNSVNLLGYPQININDATKADFILDDISRI